MFRLLLLALAVYAFTRLEGEAIMSVGYEWIVEGMAKAIKTFEGWYEGSRSFRNHNPGNLKFAGQPGAIGADETGHAIFDSDISGWEALKRQIRAAFTGASHVYSVNDTFYSFFSHYAEGNSRQYAEYVADQLGVDPNSTLGSLIS
jgi:hypothetical protein